MSGPCVLGCGEYQVFATGRCGSPTVCSLTDQIESLDFNRVMDDTSEAKIVVTVGGRADDPCCRCVGDLRSWLHSLVIYRDGELVWGPGPITNILYKTDQVEILARDVTAWLDARVVHNAYNVVNTPVVDAALALIQDALEPDDPCGIAGSVITYPGSSTVTKVIEANKEYAGESLRDLGRLGLDYTAVGPVILLGDPLVFGPFGLLTDEHFQVDLEVEERGLEFATKWYVSGQAVTGTAGGVDPYFGLVEQVASEDTIPDVTTANVAAQNRLMASNPPPLYMNVPSGAKLSPEAPVCFERLVPGAVFDVSVRNLCRDIRIQHRLTAVTVNVNNAGDESVGITLAPLGTNFNDSSGGQTGPAA